MPTDRSQTISPVTFFCLGIIVIFFAAFLVYPLLYVFARAFWWDGRFVLPFGHLFQNDIYRESLWNSLVLGFTVTVLATLVALPLAFIFAKYRFPGKGLLNAALLAPLIMPPFVGAIGVRRILSLRGGALNSLLVMLGLLDPQRTIDWLGSGFWGTVVLEILHLYPILFLNVTAAMANIDPSLEEAARNMGDHGLRLFRKVTFPLLAPGYFAGAAIVFIWSFTDLGTPLMFNYHKVAAVQIFNTRMNDNPITYVLVVTVLLMTAAIFFLSRQFFTHKETQMMSKGTVGAAEKLPTAAGRVLIYAVVLLVVGLALLPHASVILTSVAWRWSGTPLPTALTGAYFREVFTADYTLGSIKNSLLYSVSSTLINILVGVSVAYVLTRKRFPGMALLDVLSMMPLAIPGIVLAFGYLRAFSQTAIDPCRNPTALLILSYAVRRMPFMIRAAMAGFQQTDVALEEASQNLGASPLRTALRITLPLIAANIVAGATLCFSFAMLEVSDSLILADTKAYFPITKMIFQMQGDLDRGDFKACAFGVLGMILLALTLLLATKLLGKKMGAMFRMG
ncbi:MAG: iron ABC transporter permease [Planctomycetes bacterium]|nr:iron ABC transporter permease [Planctomycetota bacterium]